MFGFGIKLILILYCAFGAEGYVEQANKCYNKNDYKGAMEYLQKAIDINPKLPSIYMLRGKIREEIDDPDFEDDFNYAIELEDTK